MNSARWEPGYIPHGWKRGEPVTQQRPLGRFRGCLNVDVDDNGYPLVARARTVALHIEYMASDAEKVTAWLEWWRAPAHTEFLNAEAAPALALQPEGTT